MSKKAEFLDAVTRFCFEDHFMEQTSSSEPHTLRALTVARKNYFDTLFANADRVLSAAYQYKFGLPHDQRTGFEPEVEEAISAHGPETRAAFETLLHFCRKYTESVRALPVGFAGCRGVTFEKNGLSNEEGAELGRALAAIWAAWPDTNPWAAEGCNYVMSASRDIIEAFRGYVLPGGGSDRTDFQIAQKLGDSPIRTGRFNDEISRDQALAIARQSAANILLLKPHAKTIAETMLAWCLFRICKLGEDYRDLSNSRPAARKIMEELVSGRKNVEDIAHEIGQGGYGELRGKRKWMKNDRDREKSLKMAAQMGGILHLARRVHDGSWFDAEYKKLVTLVILHAPAPPRPQSAPGV